MSIRLLSLKLTYFRLTHLSCCCHSSPRSVSWHACHVVVTRVYVVVEVWRWCLLLSRFQELMNLTSGQCTDLAHLSQPTLDQRWCETLSLPQVHGHAKMQAHTFVVKSRLLPMDGRYLSEIMKIPRWSRRYFAGAVQELVSTGFVELRKARSVDTGKSLGKHAICSGCWDENKTLAAMHFLDTRMVTAPHACAGWSKKENQGESRQQIVGKQIVHRRSRAAGQIHRAINPQVPRK